MQNIWFKTGPLSSRRIINQLQQPNKTEGFRSNVNKIVYKLNFFHQIICKQTNTREGTEITNKKMQEELHVKKTDTRKHRQCFLKLKQ